MNHEKKPVQGWGNVIRDFIFTQVPYLVCYLALVLGWGSSPGLRQCFEYLIQSEESPRSPLSHLPERSPLTRPPLDTSISPYKKLNLAALWAVTTRDENCWVVASLHSIENHGPERGPLITRGSRSSSGGMLQQTVGATVAQGRLQGMGLQKVWIP